MSILYRNPVVRPVHLESWTRPPTVHEFRVIRGFGVPDPPRAPHNGIDLGNGLCGDLVVAPAPGVVDYAAADPLSGGANIVIVNHGSERTWVAHLATIAVRRLQTVVAGQRLGTVGNTGWSSGCHLHYSRQMRLSRTWEFVDPAPILSYVERPLPNTATTGLVAVVGPGKVSGFKIDRYSHKITSVKSSTFARASLAGAVKQGIPGYYLCTQGYFAGYYLIRGSSGPFVVHAG